MKTFKKNWLLLASLFGLGVALIGVVLDSRAQVPQPVLTIAAIGTNQFLITITNGVTSTNYSLYSRLVLADPGFPWTLASNGAPGVTNFTVSAGPDFQNFYRVLVGTDYDGDGVQDWEDGDPNNPAVGILTISIVSPAQGAIIQ